MYEYQATDLAKTLALANVALKGAKLATPEKFHSFFKGGIHFDKLSGQYEWYWVLR